MAFENEQIAGIARLARLGLRESELTAYNRDLSRILEMIEAIRGVDAATIEPLAHPLEISARLRADKITETDQRDKFLAIAPSTSAGYYLVPKVIE
ncbi:MAG: Asp-tRNA(Asn)/Glu-tRNA(Gln) amidotransferase subunit GatC [Gammaproteobacteria bacterium]|jgi:aspartyl-tRNA(Asn)/glutamyl-tRNA(Gln) amidotransferase subunit C|nr:MAG: Asp-tRNA(Asn)/Glu-tRNA(Gln) amidotransferase subunit GatC [Gammaproteobacteria bacterium]